MCLFPGFCSKIIENLQENFWNLVELLLVLLKFLLNLSINQGLSYIAKSAFATAPCIFRDD